MCQSDIPNFKISLFISQSRHILNCINSNKFVGKNRYVCSKRHANIIESICLSIFIYLSIYLFIYLYIHLSFNFSLRHLVALRCVSFTMLLPWRNVRMSLLHPSLVPYLSLSVSLIYDLLLTLLCIFRPLSCCLHLSLHLSLYMCYSAWCVSCFVCA